jgi:hypothetical protein
MFRTKSRHVVPNVVQVGPGLECTERIAGRQKWWDKLFFSGNLTNKNGDTRIGMDRIYTIGCHGDVVGYKWIQWGSAGNLRWLGSPLSIEVSNQENHLIQWAIFHTKQVRIIDPIWIEH